MPCHPDLEQSCEIVHVGSGIVISEDDFVFGVPRVTPFQTLKRLRSNLVKFVFFFCSFSHVWKKCNPNSDSFVSKSRWNSFCEEVDTDRRRERMGRKNQQRRTEKSMVDKIHQHSYSKVNRIWFFTTRVLFLALRKSHCYSSEVEAGVSGLLLRGGVSSHACWFCSLLNPSLSAPICTAQTCRLSIAKKYEIAVICLSRKTRMTVDGRSWRGIIDGVVRNSGELSLIQTKHHDKLFFKANLHTSKE